MKRKQSASSGIPQLDLLLGGVHIGDNVVWHDDAGSLASVFCLNFVRESEEQGKPLIYVTFDRSPKNLLDKLGPLGDHRCLTILDCFTHGKGGGSDVFMKHYSGQDAPRKSRTVRVEKPRDPGKVMEALYGAHAAMEGEVRFVFESITGMEELWGGEDRVLAFYSHSCPRLYELNTVAYWILEKRAHSQRLRAQINQIAQVAVEMSVKRGTTFLSVIKAEDRGLETLNKPIRYWAKDLRVTFDTEERATGRVDLGTRIKRFRNKRGLSQKELASRVGVTPSTISQVESNLIYPSLPALLKIAEILSVEVSSFFEGGRGKAETVVFPASQAVETKLSGLPEGGVAARLLTPMDLDLKAEPYLIEIPAKQALSSHFFTHKGQEVGYVLSGKVQLRTERGVFSAGSGDLIYLVSDTPSHWKNTGRGTAKLLWLKLR